MIVSCLVLFVKLFDFVPEVKSWTEIFLLILRIGVMRRVGEKEIMAMK